MNPLKLARQRLQNSRNINAQRTTDRHLNSSELSGSYAGYNAALGKMIVEMVAGGVVSSQIDNGLVEKGAIVSISAPRGGIAQSSEMPS